MSLLLLDQPDAQTLLADAVLTPEAARGCQDRLTAFLRRYPPRFYHAEQRANAALVIRGLLTRRSTTWSDTAPGGGTPVGAAGAKFPSAVPIPGRSGNRKRDGAGSPSRTDGERGPLQVDAMAVRLRSQAGATDWPGGEASTP